MDTKREYLNNPDRKLAAVCGLFCPSCTVFIGTSEDPERLRMMAERFQKPLEDLQCHGCRTDKRSFYCREICNISKCAQEKGVEFCGECSEYPCADLKAFQAEAPHRIELWKSHERIREAGFERWYMEMVEHFSCPECGTLNSAYDLKCRNCGGEPSCEYVSQHKETIVRFLADRG